MKVGPFVYFFVRLAQNIFLEKADFIFLHRLIEKLPTIIVSGFDEKDSKGGKLGFLLLFFTAGW